MKSQLRRKEKGIAIILVLSILTLLVSLVLAFFSLVQTERVSSSAFSDSIEVRNLSELPVNLVISQVRKATEYLAPSADSPQFKTWASQPGMIRVFGTELDSNQVRSTTVALYKLYSDDQVVVTQGNSSTSGGMSNSVVQSALQKDREDLMNWKARPGMYTDLNEPVAVPGVVPTNKFPILDPRASVAGTSTDTVQGFRYTSSDIEGAINAQSRDDLKARLPMPVKWIYVLKDGALITPTAANESIANFNGAQSTTGSSVSHDNPIVGRIAYWTDDETSKININTASEGKHWDPPLATTQTEKNYAMRIPVQNEFNRYPGHPAATSLSPVFQAFHSGFRIDQNRAEVSSSELQAYEHIMAISPRVNWGGSLAGTREPLLNSNAVTTGIPIKKDRLYSSVDELFLDPERAVNMPNVSPNHLEIGKFFLTTHSRSPELNLFGKPRIGLWPQSENKVHRNPKDKLLAFLSETSGTAARPWYISRKSNFTNATNPGSSQSSTEDASGSLLRIYQYYLPELLGKKAGSTHYELPGFGGGTFYQKYGVNPSNQLSAMMLDMLRWGVNSYSSSSTPGWPSYTFLPDRVNNNRGQSSAVPLRFQVNGVPELGRGIGRWPTISEVVIVFVRVDEDKTNNIPGKLQAYILLEPFVAATGPASMTANIIYQIRNMDQFAVTIDGDSERSGIFASDMQNLCDLSDGHYGLFACGSTAYTGFSSFLAGAAEVIKTPTPGAIPGKVTEFPFVSQPIDIPASATHFDFSGGAFEIRTYPGWENTVTNINDAVQVLHLELPAVRLKLPRTGIAKNGSATLELKTLAQRFRVSTDFDIRVRLIADGDTVRSLEPDVNAPPKGDLRFYAAMRHIPKQWFKVADDYLDSNVERRQFLRVDNNASNGQFGPFAGSLPSNQTWGEQSQRNPTANTAGKLVRNVMYARGAPTAAPRGLYGAMLKVNNTELPGDWENGIGVQSDGPYIRKPDEGNASFLGTTLTNANNSPYFSRHGFNKETGVSFAPNRQIASAVQFGALPTGIDPTLSLNNAPSAAQLLELGTDPSNKLRPWQTLLFCPNPASRTTAADMEPTQADHPGFQTPRDHLLLDYFWMPITEPYAISEPLSTAGKINMNYQMEPFYYIERSTGLHAVLKSSRVTAITPNSAGGRVNGNLVEPSSSASSSPYNRGGANIYKQSDASSTHSHELRYAIDPELTLEGFRQRFKQGDIFRSASEICEIFLVPKRLSDKTYATDASNPPTSYAAMTRWWNGNLNDADAFEITGDNAREMPYNHLYPRLTTKSNTFTVHYRVQALKKARSTSPTEWVEGSDLVTSDYRGSTTFERYLDPNEAQLAAPGIGGTNFHVSWDTYYRIRLIQKKQFVP